MKKKNIIKDFVLQKKEKQRVVFLLKEKKKGTFLGTWSLRKKKKKEKIHVGTLV